MLWCKRWLVWYIFGTGFSVLLVLKQEMSVSRLLPDHKCHSQQPCCSNAGRGWFDVSEKRPIIVSRPPPLSWCSRHLATPSQLRAPQFIQPTGQLWYTSVGRGGYFQGQNQKPCNLYSLCIAMLQWWQPRLMSASYENGRWTFYACSRISDATPTNPAGFTDHTRL